MTLTGNYCHIQHMNIKANRHISIAVLFHSICFIFLLSKKNTWHELVCLKKCEIVYLQHQYFELLYHHNWVLGMFDLELELLNIGCILLDIRTAQISFTVDFALSVFAYAKHFFCKLHRRSYLKMQIRWIC